MRLKYAASLFFFSSLLGFPSVTDAATIEGRLMAATFRGRITRGVSMKTRVILSDGLFKTHINHDGTFEFTDVPTGTYILKVQSPQLVYSKIRIVVTGNEVLATRVSVGDHFSDRQQYMPLPLILRPRPRPIHYIPPEGQKVAGWFGNPMILMSSFSLLMLLLMPKIMANLDADALDALRSSYDFGCLPSLAPSQVGQRPPATAPHHYNPHYQHQQQYQQHQDPSMASKDPYLVGGSSSVDDDKNEFGDEFITGVIPSWGEKGVTPTTASQAGPGAGGPSNHHYLPHHSYPSYPHNQTQPSQLPHPFQPQPQPQSLPQQQFVIPPVQSKKLK
ncbi:ER membrane protein complex subunit 7 [Entomortierella parvispora]|uniref:ER membrane protein complex subunit 7 n=1 Tax=Entomortierella parvispora TaxID=205924 RepID=A0A9P3HLH0_9FUNG|nr:ER membrane protein complex subunit 7 [Entomortierella parvispora]